MEPAMYEKIIVALGLSHGHGFRAMQVARRLRAETGRIMAVHVVVPVPSYASTYLPDDHMEHLFAEALAGVKARIGEDDGTKAVVLSGNPGPVLTGYAEEINADCIIVGSHKPDIQDYLLGSTAARVVRHALCSVHVLR